MPTGGGTLQPIYRNSIKASKYMKQGDANEIKSGSWQSQIRLI